MSCIVSFNHHGSQSTSISSLNRKRWNLAFAFIFSSRVFSQLHNISHNHVSRITPESDSITIDVVSPSLINLITDQAGCLTNLAKDKNLEDLVKLGGVQGLVSALETDADHGIDDHDVLRQQEVYGKNTYHRPPTKTFLAYLILALKHSDVLVNVLGIALALFLGIRKHGLRQGWYEGGSMVVAIFLVITVSAIINFSQDMQLDKLSHISINTKVEVVRNRRRQHISNFDVVVGDIVFLKIGDQVPADGLYVDGHLLEVYESKMTANNNHVKVTHENPFMLSGTIVADGYARFLVTSVGMNTTWGQMMSSTIQDNSKTPLQTRLKKLSSSISKISLVAAFLVQVVVLLRFFTGHTKDEDGKTEFNGSKTTVGKVISGIMGTIVAAISLVFVTIPEGLSLAVNLVLFYSMKRMMSDNKAMVKKLSACETMGSATVLCTDKTGTLTMNEMKVTEFCFGNKSIKEMKIEFMDPNVLEILREGAGLNTAAGVKYKPNSGSKLDFSGSTPTEKTILSWAELELNIDMEKLKRSCKVLQVEAFNVEKKRSGILLKKEEDNTLHVHWKGAADTIIAMCTHYYDSLGNVKPFDDFERKEYDQLVQDMSARSLRCIAFAYKQVSESEVDEGDAKIKDDTLILLGLVGINNLCRPEARKAVEDIQSAGLNVKMITGDHVVTAKAIATECGILKFNQDIDSGTVIEGIEFRNYSQKERMEKVEKICVMARASPLDKCLMVQCLKLNGHIVAFTGDGSNDAPALHEADIGLAMGIAGSEVTKLSADIVLLDDNFATVVTVLRWGRCVYRNIQKFIQFQLTVNVAALVINFVAAVSTGEEQLTAVKLVWINVIMDTFGALALATEEPTNKLMEKPPVNHEEPLISNIMWRNLLPQALYQILALLILQFKGEVIFEVNKKVKDTLIFNTFVLCQVCNELNARKLESKNVYDGTHKNKFFLGIIGITVILQILMVEFSKNFTDTERLSWGQWGACAGIAVVSWPIGYAVKSIRVPNKTYFQIIVHYLAI